MTRLFYFIRHGETDWNQLGRLQGRSDIPLNQIGISQAQKLQSLIQTINPDLIYSSPLLRAKQTAEHFKGNLNLQILTDPQLMEVSLGAIEGLTAPEVFKKFGEDSFDRWRNLNWSDDFTYPNGESKRQAVERMQLFLDKTHFPAQASKVVVVSHGLLLRRFLGWITNNPEFQRISNTSVFQIEQNMKNFKLTYQGKIYDPTEC